MKEVYLAGGCFWCISDYLLSFHGIKDVIVGYSGGNEKEVSYEDVKHQLTGHRETVKVIYKEEEISLEEIIDIYLSYIDPLDKDGQYIDKGFSYTCALYFQNEDEKNLFILKVNKLKEELNQEIYIKVEPLKFFIEAESYHQHYGDKNPEAFKEELEKSHRSCHLVRKKN